MFFRLDSMSECISTDTSGQCPNEKTRNGGFWSSWPRVCSFFPPFLKCFLLHHPGRQKRHKPKQSVSLKSASLTGWFRRATGCSWINDAADLNNAVWSGVEEIVLWSSTDELGGNFRRWLHKLSATRQLSRTWAWVLEEGSIQWNLWRGFKTNGLCKDALSEFAFHDAM